MQEIERKFLVKSTDFISQSHKNEAIIQGYLNSNPQRAVRVRVKGSQAFITVKGIGNTSGTTRFEWEKAIPVDDAKQLLALCEPNIIEKIRYEVLYQGFLFEIDVFEGVNQGLILAELELKNENEAFPVPSWLGEEVTGQEAYYNAYICKHPFKL